MRQIFYHVVDLEVLVNDLEWLARVLQRLLRLMEVFWIVGTSKVAEILHDLLTLSISLDIWVLLGRGVHVGGLQALAAQSILIERQEKERLLLVQVTPTFCVFNGESCEDVVETVAANFLEELVEEDADRRLFFFLFHLRLVLTLSSWWLSVLCGLCLFFAELKDVDESSHGLLLVIDQQICDLSIKCLVCQLITSVFTLVNAHVAETDLIDFYGILSPLTTQMLLVHGQESLAPRDFNKALSVFWAILVDHVQRGLEHCDTLFVSVHLLVIGIGVGFNLLGDGIHERRHNLIQFLFALNGAW